ncbi:MAG: hypothetical protein HW400_526 [Candidatus Levybacteria bacterium]|nr:hypothetical protein [Candidatus Levybacteria bacterium]
MVGVAQWLERQLVELKVAGSTPVAHPKVLDNDLFRELESGQHLVEKIYVRVFSVKDNGI